MVEPEITLGEWSPCVHVVCARRSWQGVKGGGGGGGLCGALCGPADAPGARGVRDEREKM